MRSFLLAQDEFAAVHGERILTARISLPAARYPASDDKQRFFDTLVPRLKSIPGVQVVSAVSNPPGGGALECHFELEGQPIPEAERRPAAAGVAAWPDYFSLLGMPVLRGREFTDSDGLPGSEAAIVSRQFVARHYAGRDPIGTRLRLFGPDGRARPWMTVIGVVAGFRQYDPSNPVNDSQVFIPYRFETSLGMAVLLRTNGDPSRLAPALRSEVQQLDQDLALSSVQTLEAIFIRSRWHWRVFGTVFLIFAVLALGMAGVGIYAVMAHATSSRTHEIGIRLALGAGFGAIMRLALRRGLIQLALGMGIGLAAALGVCRLMARLLFKVSPHDPATLTAVAAVLAAVGLLACWMPARRAARLDPFRALRQD
jgi:predicted permease